MFLAGVRSDVVKTNQNENIIYTNTEIPLPNVTLSSIWASPPQPNLAFDGIELEFIQC